MDRQELKKWLKTTAMATVGGGIGAAVTAAFDPNKYNIRHDIGSGKLWIYFFEGFGVTLAALLIKSPLGQQVMGAYRDSQTQLAANKADVEAARKQFKPPAKDK